MGRNEAIEAAARAVVEHDDRCNSGGFLEVGEGVRVRAALRAALALPPAPVADVPAPSGADTYWLIERVIDGAHWWYKGPGRYWCYRWTRHATEAERFATQAAAESHRTMPDARECCADEMRSATVTEHMDCAPPTAHATAPSGAESVEAWTARFAGVFLREADADLRDGKRGTIGEVLARDRAECGPPPPDRELLRAVAKEALAAGTQRGADEPLDLAYVRTMVTGDEADAIIDAVLAERGVTR